MQFEDKPVPVEEINYFLPEFYRFTRECADEPNGKTIFPRDGVTVHGLPKVAVPPLGIIDLFGAVDA